MALADELLVRGGVESRVAIQVRRNPPPSPLRAAAAAAPARARPPPRGRGGLPGTGAPGNQNRFVSLLLLLGGGRRAPGRRLPRQLRAGV